MQTYTVRKMNRLGNINVRVPGSKSITNRALLLAALTNGKCRVKGTLFSDDSRHFVSCLQKLGFEVVADEDMHYVEIVGHGGEIPLNEAKIDVGSAGTAARFLTAFLGLSSGKYYIDASEQMKKRPMDALCDSLEELGAHIEYIGERKHLPLIISNNRRTKSEVTVNIDKSSQFLSALLISGCLFNENFKINISGTHGMAYIDLTIKMMNQFGGKIEKINDSSFMVPKDMCYKAQDYDVEPDVSAACYFYAMAPLLGKRVQVKNVHLNSLQGDIKFLDIMKEMGCSIYDDFTGIIVDGEGVTHFSGVDIDMGAFSDQTMTLAAIAPFADTPTTITGIGHIRYQESNRIEAIITELGKMGIRTEELEDGIKIYPGQPKPTLVNTYDDHRMAMAFSLIGMRTGNIVINDPLCCRKTFEGYFEVLDQLYL